MNLFITGATGFIGRSVVKKLLDQHEHVTLLLMPGEASPFSPDVRIVHGDITRTGTLRNLMEGHDTIIHLAGTVGFQCWKNCKTINITGTQNVVDAAIASGVKRFIHISSVSVYGRVPRIKLTEDLPYRKIGDPFGDTKIDAEKVVRHAAAAHHLDLTIIRPTTVYGKHDKRFVPFLVRNLRKRDCCLIGNKNHSVDLVHVADVVDMIMHVLKEPRSIGSIYNLTHQNNPTWKEMLEVIVRELDTHMPRRSIPYPLAYGLAGLMEMGSFFTGKTPRLTRYMVRSIGQQYDYSTEQAEKDLGFKAQVDLIEGMSDSVRSVSFEPSI